MKHDIYDGSEIMKKNLMKVFFLLLVSLAFFLIGDIVGRKTTIRPSSNKQKEPRQLEKQSIKQLKKHENIVILGDSITELYPIDEAYGSLPVVKSGVSGYKTTDILSRIESMAYQYNPTKLFLLIGINDVAYETDDKKVNQTISNIEKIIKKIRKNRSETKIYVQSLYPINRELNDNKINEDINEAIIYMNKKIKKYCKEKNITYINVHDELIDDDGNFAEKYTNDGIHPNTLGYVAITRVLSPYIYEGYEISQ